MITIDRIIEDDLARPVTTTYLVLSVGLDIGTIHLAGRPATIGHDDIIGVLMSVDGANDSWSATFVSDASMFDAWWINRPAIIREVTPTLRAVSDGIELFNGIVANQPRQSNGILSIDLVPFRRRVVPVPDLGIIAVNEWPLADASVMGATKPEVFGTVDGCPLMPVAIQPRTTLSVSAVPGDSQLEVGDASVFSASGAVVIDGQTYSYSTITDNALLGMSVTSAHGVGTMVAQAGNNVYLAAGHSVSAISDVRAAGSRVAGGVVDLAAATVTFSSHPSLPVGATRYTEEIHFDALSTGNNCSNGVNAIRAAIGNFSQTATPGLQVKANTPGNIQFARPVDGNRIIAGAYSVSFTVAVGAEFGNAIVRIGSDIVWSYSPVIGVIYNESPSSSLMDADTDVLPVTVESDGSEDQVTVTITAASRVIVTGNLDAANFATIAPAQKLSVIQSTLNPSRGRVASMRLVVSWFATTDSLGTADVKFGVASQPSIGKLKLTANAATALNQTVTIGSITQGSAGLPQQNLAALISGGTGTLQNVPNVVRMTYPCQLFQIGTTTFWETRIGLRPPPNVLAGDHVVRVYFSSGSVAHFFAIYDNVTDANTPDGVVRTFNGVSGQAITSKINVVTANSAPLVLVGQFFTSSNLSLDVKALFMEVEWRIAAVTRSDTPATGAPIGAQNLPNSGIGVSLSGNSISLTVPAPPRVMNTVFDLVGYTDWSQLTNAKLFIELTGGTANVCVAEAMIQVEYDEIIYAPADGLTATVTGRNGNPAEVMAYLSAASGQAVENEAKHRLSAWCVANSFQFARRIDEATDALTLLQYAMEQANVLACETNEGLAFIRWLDLAGGVTRIAEEDLMAPAIIEWAERIENSITMRYAEDYVAGNGFNRAIQVTPTNNSSCTVGASALGEVRGSDIEAGWIRSDAVATKSIADLASRVARPRRIFTLECPYSIVVSAGELIEYLPLGASATDGILARVVLRTHNGGWPVLTAEEINWS